MYLVQLSLSKVALVENIRAAFIFKGKYRIWFTFSQVLKSWSFQIVVFAEEGKEIHKEF